MIKVLSNYDEWLNLYQRRYLYHISLICPQKNQLITLNKFIFHQSIKKQDLTRKTSTLNTFYITFFVKFKKKKKSCVMPISSNSHFTTERTLLLTILELTHNIKYLFTKNYFIQIRLIYFLRLFLHFHGYKLF